MSGHAYEQCADWLDSLKSNYYEFTSQEPNNARSSNPRSIRVIRGRSFGNNAIALSVAIRRDGYAGWGFLSNSNYILKDYLKTDVRFLIQDVRQQLPNGNFDLILRRNLIFTYFQQDLQSKLLEQIVRKLKPNVFFVLGVDESLKSSGGLLAP